MSLGLRLQSLFRLILSICALVGLSGFSSAQTVSKLALADAAIAGGTNTTATVTLSKKAGSSGVVVLLTSSNTSASVPPSITVANGQTSAEFTVKTVAVAANTSATIKAKVGSSSSAATLTIKAPVLTSFSINPNTVTGGANATGTVELSGSAPNGGISIKLAGGSSTVSVPASVLVAGGAASTTFKITTQSVLTKTTEKITASLASTSIGVTLTLSPVTLTGLSLNPTSVAGGNSSTGTVTLSDTAGTGGVTVALSSSVSSVSTPNSVSVPAGSSTATFTVSTKAVTAQVAAKITAKLSSASISATLTVTTAKTFAGSYLGSFYSPSGSLGPVSLTITAGGSITGTATDDSSGTASKATIVGTVSSSGATTITYTAPGKQPVTISGSAKFGSNGVLLVDLTDSSSTPIALTLTTSGQPSIFAGSYSGISTGADGHVTTFPSLTISSSGTLNAVVPGATTGGTVTGSINASGILTYSVKPNSGTSYTGVGYLAFDSAGVLYGYTFDADGGSSVLVLNRT